MSVTMKVLFDINSPLRTSNTAKHIFQLRETVQQRFMLVFLTYKFKR